MSAAVKGGLFPENGVNTLATAHTTSSNRRAVSQLMGRKGMRALREAAVTLNGVVAGSAALATNARVEANEELGGARTIETENLINRVTVAGDVTDITADLYTQSSKTYDPTPVANLDGNPLGTR